MSHPLPAIVQWPTLNWEEWKETAETLHMMTQIVGKTRMALTPIQNHWWNVTLYVTAHGLSTSPMPLADCRLLDIEFDLINHELVFRTNAGETKRINLRPMTVADFYRNYMATLKELRVDIQIDTMPAETVDPISHDTDIVHASYDKEAVSQFFKVLGIADTLLKRFSTNFLGKISPVHFFWGSFDLAVTRFNGKRAPVREDAMQNEAYSHEVISAGFWPGNGGYGKAAFYAYAAPAPQGLDQATLQGKGAFNPQIGEFLLDYNDALASPDPADTILQFLEETYHAAATLAHWDREALDRHDAIARAVRDRNLKPIVV